jgi:hypothetical protein
VENSCFQDNLVGASDIVVFGSTFVSSMNYAANTSGTLCGFSSVFQNIQQFDSFTPDCVEATSDACVRDITIMPSVSPSDGPTSILTDAPSSFPTSFSTTPSPLGQLSAGPSRSPSEFRDSGLPTDAPIDFAWPETSVPAAGYALSTWFVISILGLQLLHCFLSE